MAEKQICIDCDDNCLDIIRKVNTVLAPHHLMFLDDGIDHDEYCLFTLIDSKEQE